MDAAVVGLPVSSPQPTQLTFEDGFGERRFALGAVSEPLEVLKLSSVLSSVSSFDFALRERGARLSGFRHDAYGRVRSIELDRRTSALVITSDYVPGIRLSTLLAEAQKRAIPFEINAIRCVVRQLVAAASALQESASDISNGAIAPERIVITPSGRVIVMEYVLGAALEQLAYSRSRYWRELGIALPGLVGPAPFDARADITQIGAVALALILGRPLAVDEYPERVPDLIQNATLRSTMGSVDTLPAGLRDWLLQALQLDQWESFASPADARASLDDAFGPENTVAELGGLQIFLTRYASVELPVDPPAEVPPQDDLAPRLEAMKAFLARYPSRRTAARTQAKVDETLTSSTTPPATTPPGPAATPAPAPASADPTALLPSSLFVSTPAPPPEVAKAHEPEPVQFEASPLVAPAPEPEPEIQLPDSSAIPSYVEERRSATPVMVTHRQRILAAIAGVVLLVLIGLVVWYFRSPSPPAQATLSVGTSPPGITVFVDGTQRGVTPLGIELPPGEHVIELRTDTERRRIPVTLTAGSQVSQFYELARPSQTNGELLVRTEPLGATVTVDGKYVGRSPVSVPDLTAGTHTVLMQHDAGTVTERVLVESGRTQSLVVSLGGGAPKSATAGWIRVEAPTDVQVFENGRRIGSSDLERIMLPVGRHDLEFSNDALGYRDQRTVQVSAGQASGVRLEWPRGTMAVNAIPWAEVFVDGNRVGETPIGSIAVPIGTHEVVFRHPELGERRLAVTVKMGEPQKVGVDLRSK